MAAAQAAPTGYAVDVQDEVMVQNLTCDEILDFKNKPPAVLFSRLAGAMLNEPQHANETSETLFGAQLTRLMLTASNNPPANHGVGNASTSPCTRIVPKDSPPDGAACHADAMSVSEIVDQSMSAALAARIPQRPGELKLQSTFDRAAKFRNCGGG
ncbi:MAG: hypothetical protein JWM33_2554 [Caulobacteraceae bacterium]|nr:hypothetical protein [Caulobacteraceae bacterium]